MSQPVGYMMPRADGEGHEVICRECDKIAREDSLAARGEVDAAAGLGRVGLTPIYRENIHPYRQHCASCGKIIVKGQTPAWPELFERSRTRSGGKRRSAKPTRRRAARLASPGAAERRARAERIRKLSRGT